jgi:hypothetical protein
MHKHKDLRTRAERETGVEVDAATRHEDRPRELGRFGLDHLDDVATQRVLFLTPADLISLPKGQVLRLPRRRPALQDPAAAPRDFHDPTMPPSLAPR